MGQHVEAYHYAKRHLEISRDTGDRMGQATAQLNMADLCRTLGYTPNDAAELPHERKAPAVEDNSDSKKSRRVSMEHMDLIKMTPDAKKAAAAAAADANGRQGSEDKENNGSLNKSGLLDEEDFFDFISRFQSKRMDDQRCSLTVPNSRGNEISNWIQVSSLFMALALISWIGPLLLHYSSSKGAIVGFGM